MYKGYPFSQTTYYRRKKKAEILGCTIMEVSDTRGKHKNHARGEKHYRWQKGKHFSRDGYVKIRVGTSHPLADPNGYVYEHKLVVLTANTPGASLLARFPDEYVVHHINGDRKDNRLENLTVMTKGKHNKLHMPERDPKNGRFVSKKAAGHLLDGKEHNEFPV